MCNLSILTPVKYISSESLLNIDSSFGFCFDHIDRNKQHQHFVCDFAHYQVYLKTRLHELLNFFMLNLIYIY